MKKKNQPVDFASRTVPGVGSDAGLASVPYLWESPFSAGDKVICHVPNGWGGHQGNMLDQLAYSGAGLTHGMPTHGMLYCVRGFDRTCDEPAIYLVGITGTLRHDGSEWSFSARGFRKVRG